MLAAVEPKSSTPTPRIRPKQSSRLSSRRLRKKPGLGITSQTVLSVSWSCISTPVAVSSSVTVPAMAAMRPVRGRALATTICCTTPAPSEPMKRPSSRCTSPRAALAPNAQPATVTTRTRTGAREKREK